MRQILERYPQAGLKVFVLWSPILYTDSRSAAEMASAYLPDSRAQHFWDLWSYGVRNYTEQLRFPKDQTAWDIFVVYKPQLAWREKPPAPTTWFQNLNLEHGIKYSPQLLEAELQKWIQ